MQTQFGNATSPTGTGGGGGGGEIDAGYATIENGRLYVPLTGNIEPNFNNTNVLCVSGGTLAAAPGVAEAVLTGLEFAVALADLGDPGVGDVIKIHAAHGNGDNNFHSNQILGSLPAPQGDLGGDGGGNFTGSLSGIDFNNFADEQFFTVAVPESTSLALLGLGDLAALRRRR